MGNFDEADLHKANSRAQDKYDETATISSISHQIGRKLQARKQLRLHQFSIYHHLNTPPLHQYLLKKLLMMKTYCYWAYNEAYLVVNDVHPFEDVSLVASTATDHIIASKVKQATSLLTQEFNATLNKYR